MRPLPAGVVAYKRTPEFAEDSVPAGLLKAHTTKPGTWGRIVVTHGSLLYRILEPSVSEHRLVPGCDGVVEPTVPHEVQPLGEVRFHVEFLRRPDGVSTDAGVEGAAAAEGAATTATEPAGRKQDRP